VLYGDQRLTEIGPYYDAFNDFVIPCESIPPLLTPHPALTKLLPSGSGGAIISV
jgi:hypothetical protein